MEEPVAVLTPRGRDAQVASEVLSRAGIACITCSELARLRAALDAGAAAALVTEEALTGPDVALIWEWLETQPPGSAFPFVVLATAQRGRRAAAGLELLGRLGNVVLLERPLNAETLVSAVRAAQRARQRQYEARRHLQEREKAEEQLRDLNASLEQRVAAAVAEQMAVEAALRQAQKMEAVGQLTGGIAHDFNNLLTAVSGNLELIERAASDPVRVRWLAASALRAAQRGAKLTASLLAFSRRQTLRPEPIDANLLIQESTTLLRRALGDTIRLELSFDPALEPCLADAGQLEAAMLNLTLNARDAMPSSGTLTIQTRMVDLGAEQLTENAEARPGRYVAIAARDTGSGMRPDVLVHAFEPFFTTKDVGKGSGLGLSQVYGFVRQLRGHVTIDSIVGRGTTVTMFLPRTDALPVALDETRVQGQLATVSAATLLVVEDDDDVLAVACTTLRASGYRVIVARDGEEGLRVLRLGEPVELLFSDIMMPNGVSGTELARQALILRPGIKILLTTGRATTTPENELQDFEVLQKPYRQAQLAERVATILSNGVAHRIV